MRTSEATLIGGRNQNEDTLVSATGRPRKALDVWTVCDGLGGEVAGEKASAAAVAAFIQSWNMLVGIDEPEVRLRQSLLIANGALQDNIDADPGLAGMGTTLVAVEVERGTARWISVGDSPLWLVSASEGHCRRLNAAHNPPTNRNRLLSALTGEPIPLIDTGKVTVKSGDTLVVASDGLEALKRDKLKETVLAGGPDLAATLAELAVESGGKRADNTTVFAIEICDGDG